MKKLLAGLLSITLILGHASCNKAPASVQTSTTVSSISSVSVSEPEPEPVPEPTPAPEPESKSADTPADNSAEGTGIETGTGDPWTFTDMDTVKYAKTRVNVRDLPGIDGKKLGVLNQNDRVHITGRCNETGWYRFEYKDGIGYSHGDYFVNEKVNVQVNVETKNDNAAQDSQSSGNTSGGSTSGGSQSGGNQNIPALIGSYPNPELLSLNVTPITKDNYSTYVTGNPPSDLSEYKSDTVFGFVVRPNGLISLLNLFDRIEFYAYDAQYYASAMQPISSALASSNPSSGTTLTSVSNEGQPDVQGKTYFYPATDNNFAAKVSISLKRTSDNALLSDPRAIFLFDDFTGNKAACESALLSRTSGLAGTGYTVNTVVSDTFANGVFFRGRDYEFTFRLHVDQNEVQDAIDRMYPEVLGENIACILKAPATCEAPYEEPSYFFYPADSGSNYLTYGYYILSREIDFTGINMGKTAGTGIKTRELTAVPQEWRDVISAAVIPNSDAQVLVEGLSKNSQVSVSFTENRYIPSYNRGRTVTAFTRFFVGKHEKPNAEFAITPDDNAGRVNIDLTFDTAAQAKSVTAVVGTFTNDDDSTKTTTKKLYITSVSGTDMHGYVEYTDLDGITGGSNRINASLRIYYDTGVEGFQQADSPYSTAGNSLICIREAGETGEGRYILPVDETTGSDFCTSSLNSQDILAIGSLFTMNLGTGAGAQNGNIAGTLSTLPGSVSVLINGFNGRNSTAFQYLTGSNAVAGPGGMYDANIIGNQLNFTVSLVKNDGTSKGANSNSNNEIFEIQENSGP